MSDTPTPETDACWDSASCNLLHHAQNMERERDEAREEIEALRHEYHGAKAMAGGFKDKIKSLTEQRDEAREAIQCAIDSYKKVKWGYDGCCGTSVIMDKLEDFLSKEETK